MPEPGKRRDVLLWHVHGAWTAAFVAGAHRYLVPVTPARDARGLGLAGRTWPNAREVPAGRLSGENIDVMVLQRPEELELATRWTGRRPGVDVPAVFVEHNAPRPHAELSAHPLGERSDIPIVHVTDFNRLMWDNGAAPTRVIAHGLADPGHLYSGDIRAAATMINEPLRRGRTVGTDLLAPLSAHVPIDVWGIGSTDLTSGSAAAGRITGRGDVPTPRLWAEIARRRVYLHTARWTSLGLSLLEAMLLGMPVVVVASTMAPLVVPAEAGVVSADVATLGHALEAFVTDHGAAGTAGKTAREFALAHFGLDRFLRQWDQLIEELCA